MPHLLKLTTLMALLAGATFCTPPIARADRDGHSHHSDRDDDDRDGHDDNDRDDDSDDRRTANRSSPQASATSRSASVTRSSSNLATASSRRRSGTHRRASIVGTAASPMARGTAEIETRSNGTRELEVKVRSLNLRAGTLVSIDIDGRNLGNARVSRGRISFKARGASVPAVGSSSNIVLRTLDGGTVASGSF